MRYYAHALLTGVCCVTWSCSADHVTSPSSVALEATRIDTHAKGEISLATRLESQVSLNPIVASATGSGHTTFRGEWRNFTFTASKHADGTVRGEFQIKIRAFFDARVHGRVVCLEVIGKEAWIGVVLEKSTFPFVEEEGFRVVDRGEGVNDHPDQFSGGGLPGGTTYCAQKPLTQLRDLEAGNIQVRG